MRLYALLFGTVATLALASVGQLAVRSSGVAARAVTAQRDLWDGGMLQTLRIVGDGSGGPAIAMLGEPAPSHMAQCQERDRKSRQASTARRPQLGVEM